MLEYLALWPVIHFLVIFIVSKMNRNLDLLKNIYAIIYLDWLFVPFNFFIAEGADFSWMLFSVFLTISLIATIYLHKRWHSINDGSRQANYLINKKGLTEEGWIHFIFMIVQTSIVMTVLLSASLSIYYIYMMICLLAYLIGYILIVKYVRRIRLVSKAEMPFLIAGLVVVLTRTIIYFLKIKAPRVS